ncbi:unnamed protein product [Caenorhabditis angaria]|uniref:Inhibitor of growth protein n=1 Tax=Caenorhabditis angaria TaxID=860376 RepID=A0A9P1IDV7_9PELO|nr:unnamed protein product [Caenorhabditis angaria]
MLFLDDFLEMLDELPAELKERSDEVLKMDADVETRLRRNREAVSEFFEYSGVGMTEEQRAARYKALQDEFSKIRSINERKYLLMKKMQDLLTKYHNHLEKEKTNFQCEMEADNSGVTEMIEKRYTEYVEACLAARKERKRKHGGGGGSGSSREGTVQQLSKESSEKIARILQEGTRLKMEMSDDSAQSAMSSAVPSPAPRGRPPKNNVMFSSAVAEDSPIPRRKSNANTLRTSFMGGRISPNPSEKSWSNFGMDETSQSFTPTTPQLTPNMPNFVGSESRHGRPRKLTTRVQEMFKETLQRQRNHGNNMIHQTPPTPTTPQSVQQTPPSLNSSSTNMPPPSTPPSHHHNHTQPPPIETEMEGSDDEDEESEDSRRWCFCHEKSYGEMVACDNKSCPYMWFHYPCVGILAPPKGKWYCPHCVSSGAAARIEESMINDNDSLTSSSNHINNYPPPQFE